MVSLDEVQSLFVGSKVVENFSSSSKLVYSNISGESIKNLYNPIVSKLYKEVHYDTGDFIEQYSYFQPVAKNCQSIFLDNKNNKSSKEISKVKTKEEIEEYRSYIREKKIKNPELLQRQLNRKKKEIRRLINTNCRRDNKRFCSFFTATYQENQIDEYKAREDFNLFIKRLQFNYPGAFDKKSNRDLSFDDYMWFAERQKRGAIHFHVIFFNCPFLSFKELTRLWEKGSIDIHNIKKVNRVGSYVCKYLTSQEKIHFENPIIGKTWSKSQDLLIPVRREYPEYTDFFTDYKVLFQRDFDIPETGNQVIYTLYQKPPP